MRCPHCDEPVDDASVVCPVCNKSILSGAPRPSASKRLDPARALDDLESKSRVSVSSTRVPPARSSVPAPPVAADREQRSPIAKHLSAILVLLSLIVAAQVWQIVRGMSVKAQGWEYVIEGPTDEQLKGRLQTLGLAGWELVSARRATTQRDGETEGIYEMIFRRPADLLAVPTAPE